MSTATQPIWKDPFVRIMGCITATIVTWMLFVKFVTVPYLFIPAGDMWLQVIAPIIERFFESPEELFNILAEGPAMGGAIAVFMWSWIFFVVLAIPVFATVALPLGASYLFWMELVYKLVLNESVRY